MTKESPSTAPRTESSASSVDDIDRELKLVQLQRERLALERELASRDAGKAAKHAVRNAAGAVAGGVAVTVQATGTAFARTWKAIVILLVLAGGIATVLALKEQERKEAQQRWQVAKKKFISEQCPCIARAGDDLIAYTACLTNGELRCEEKADYGYRKQVPAPQ